jgi:two-component system phosphate regulon response regulator PhoB
MGEEILIVDDEPDVAGLLKHHLVRAGFSVKIANHGRAALRWIKKETPRLVVLDLRLPKISGLDICRLIKSDSLTRRIPVIMLSGQTDEVIRVLVFELGADDYVVKPFSPRELVLRIKAILRSGSANQDNLRVGDLVLDRSCHQVKIGDRVVKCTATEFKLLAILMEQQGRTQSRAGLRNEIWGSDAVIDIRAVDVQIGRLRKKLGSYECYIETVRGFGYRLRNAECGIVAVSGKQ